MQDARYKVGDSLQSSTCTADLRRAGVPVVSGRTERDESQAAGSLANQRMILVGRELTELRASREQFPLCRLLGRKPSGTRGT